MTGGAGYIGSTTAAALEAAGHVPVVLDSLTTGPRAFVGDRIFYEGDVGDRDLVATIAADHPEIECAVHLAARTIVPESVSDPAAYYRNNVSATLELVDALGRAGIRKLVFSSSAAVYGPSDTFEVHESSPLVPASPYARTKLVAELMLRDFADAGVVDVIALRYFNPIGSGPDLSSGIHAREPSHVLGQLLVAGRTGSPFTITGTDLATPDGTGIRDYVHVWDIARAHVAAVERFDAVVSERGERFVPLNLGTGAGTSVRELISSFERVSGLTIDVRDAPPRPGDTAGTFANVAQARELLHWSSTLSLDDAIRSALEWDALRQDRLGYP